MQVVSECEFNKDRLKKIFEARIDDPNIVQLILSSYPEDYKCHRDAYHNGLCMFHSAKKADNFAEKLDEEIERMLNDDALWINYYL